MLNFNPKIQEMLNSFKDVPITIQEMLNAFKDVPITIRDMNYKRIKKRGRPKRRALLLNQKKKREIFKK